MKPLEAIGIALAGIGAFIGGLILSCQFKTCAIGQGGRGDVSVTFQYGLMPDIISSILPPRFKGTVKLIDNNGKEIGSLGWNIPQGQTTRTVTFFGIPHGTYTLQWDEVNNGWSGTQVVVHSLPATFVMVSLGNPLVFAGKPRYSLIQSV